MMLILKGTQMSLSKNEIVELLSDDKNQDLLFQKADIIPIMGHSMMYIRHAVSLFF